MRIFLCYSTNAQSHLFFNGESAQSHDAKDNLASLSKSGLKKIYQMCIHKDVDIREYLLFSCKLEGDIMP